MTAPARDGYRPSASADSSTPDVAETTGAGAGTAAAGRSPRPSHGRWAVAVVGLLVALAFGSLVAAGLNGSSIGWLRNGQADPNLVWGEPRAWRGDEWGINTPSSVGNDRVGLPDFRQLGLTDTDVATAVLAGPSQDWVTVLRPQDWGYALLSADKGLAWHWWSSFALSIVGLMGMFRAMRVRTTVAVGLTLMGTFSPYTGVFSSPSTALFLGFGGIAVGTLTASLRARSVVGAVTWALVAAWSATALVVVLYPPWTVSVGLVALALVVGLTLDHRFPWRRVVLAYGTAVGAAGAAMVAFFLSHQAAIAASAATIYPGQRRSTSGDGKLEIFLGAPAHPWILRSGALVPEVSSTWIPVGVVLVAMLLVATAVVRRRPAPADGSRPAADQVEGTRERTDALAYGRLPFTALTTTLVTVLLLAWAFLPLPAIVGRLTQLERVQPGRLQLAIGLLALVWLALASLRRTTRPVVEALLWVLGVGATALVTFWARQGLDDVTGPVPGRYLLASVLVLAGGAALLVTARTRIVGCVVLAAYCVGMWALVNPLYRGLGALVDEPVVVAMEQQVAAQPHLRVITFEIPFAVGSQQLAALANASGADVLSGSTHYPDRALMEKLAPGQEDLWNNYAWYRWVADPTADQARISRLAPDANEIRINPCGASARLLAPDVLLSDQPLTGFSCLVQQPTIPWPGTGRTIYEYRVNR